MNLLDNQHVVLSLAAAIFAQVKASDVHLLLPENITENTVIPVSFVANTIEALCTFWSFARVDKRVHKIVLHDESYYDIFKTRILSLERAWLNFFSIVESCDNNFTWNGFYLNRLNDNFIFNKCPVFFLSPRDYRPTGHINWNRRPEYNISFAYYRTFGGGK